MLAVLLALPALRADDKPKEDTTLKSPKERFDALVKEFSTKRSGLLEQIQKAKGEERKTLIQKYQGLGKDYAEKIYKLAEDNPKEPVATDAMFWVLQNGAGAVVNCESS